MPHGKNSKVFVNGYNFSKQFTSFDLQKSAETSDKSGFTDESKTFNSGQETATLNVDGLFDDTSNAADEILAEAIGVSGTIWCVFPEGDAITKSGYGVDGINTQHNVMSTKDDNARISANCQSNTGAERIVSLMALNAKSASGSGTVNDNGAATTDGGSAYLQATAVSGSVVVMVEHSSDNSTFSTLASFTVSSVSAQRVEIDGTINRYTRVAYTLDGGETITMQVSLHREE